MFYSMCMSRVKIDIDDNACARIMRRFQLKSRQEAVNLALRKLAGEAVTVEEARQLRGSGWEGNLEAMRKNRKLSS